MDINPATFTQSIPRFLHRFHIIIFVVVALGALSLGIFIVYQNILAVDDPHGYTSQSSNTSFDTVTSRRVDELHTSDYRLAPADSGQETPAPRPLKLDGRLNPFVE
jgi:hypothetical protein